MATSFMVIYGHWWSFYAFQCFKSLSQIYFDHKIQTRIQTRTLTNIQKYFKNPEVQMLNFRRGLEHEPSHGFRLGYWYVRKPGPNSVKLNLCLPTYVFVYVH